MCGGGGGDEEEGGGEAEGGAGRRYRLLVLRVVMRMELLGRTARFSRKVGGGKVAMVVVGRGWGWVGMVCGDGLMGLAGLEAGGWGSGRR